MSGYWDYNMSNESELDKLIRLLEQEYESTIQAGAEGVKKNKQRKLMLDQLYKLKQKEQKK